MFCYPGYNFLHQVLATSDLNYLEIGVFNGDGIAGLAKAYPEKQMYGIDPFIEDGYTMAHTGVARGEVATDQKTNTMDNIRNVTNIALSNLTSVQFSEWLTDTFVERMNIGWVLIDGSHHYEDVANDITMAMRLIGSKSGGIVFDDVGLASVGKAYQEFLVKYAGKYSPAMDIYTQEPGNILVHYINHE